MKEFDISDIPLERRREIDAILKKTEEDMEQNRIETISMEEFREHLRKMAAELFAGVIRKNDIEAVREFLKDGEDPNAATRKWEIETETPMIFEALSKEMVKLLLESGADANSCMVERKARWIKKNTDDSDDFEFKRINSYTKHTILEEAIRTVGVDPDAKDIIRLLLEHGADPNATICSGREVVYGNVIYEKKGASMLYCAVNDTMDKEVVGLLLEYGADINVDLPTEEMTDEMREFLIENGWKQNDT